MSGKILVIWGDLGSNGGCTKDCGQQDCEGYSEECKAYDHMLNITPNTPVTLGQIFGEHISKDQKFIIAVTDLKNSITMQSNSKINTGQIIRDSKPVVNCKVCNTLLIEHYVQFIKEDLVFYNLQNEECYSVWGDDIIQMRELLEVI